MNLFRTWQSWWRRLSDVLVPEMAPVEAADEPVRYENEHWPRGRVVNLDDPVPAEAPCGQQAPPPEVAAYFDPANALATAEVLAQAWPPDATLDPLVITCPPAAVLPPGSWDEAEPQPVLHEGRCEVVAPSLECAAATRSEADLRAVDEQEWRRLCQDEWPSAKPAAIWITSEWLRKRRACDSQFKLFEETFGGSVKLTRANLLHGVEAGLSIAWLACRILAGEQREALERGLDPAYAVLWAARADAHSSYAFSDHGNAAAATYRAAHVAADRDYQRAAAGLLADALGLPVEQEPAPAPARMITAAWLVAAGACDRHVAIFRETFGESAALTRANLVRAERAGLMLCWLADRTLARPALHDYDRAVVALWPPYCAAVARARAEFPGEANKAARAATVTAARAAFGEARGNALADALGLP